MPVLKQSIPKKVQCVANACRFLFLFFIIISIKDAFADYTQKDKQ